MTTKIEWTEEVWNPTTGCDRVSAGCDNCYALTLAKRLKGMGQAKYQRDGDPRTSGPGFGLTTHADVLNQPLRWKRPRRIFVNSMSDLFHDAIPDEYIARVFAVMAATPQHTYQLLTKRHGRMRSLLNRPQFADLAQDLTDPTGLASVWPLPNLWLGVSVENQQWADIRIPALLDTPAAVRWLSCEPLLGPVDLRAHFAGHCAEHDFPGGFCVQRHHPGVQHLDWVVAGGESGPGARPMEPAWARFLRDQCTAAGVPFFFKQWGEWAPNGYRGIGRFKHPERLVGPLVDDMGHREVIERVGKKRAGRLLDGRTWDEYPERAVPTPVLAMEA